MHGRIVCPFLGRGCQKPVLSIISTVSPQVRYYLAPPWERATVPDPVLGRRLSPYFPGHDRWGYRNIQVPSRAHVLAIGDSLTYGHGAVASETWPRQLEQLSGKTVYNAGVGGYGPCEYESILNDLLVLKPSIVILGLYMGNDVSDVYRSVYIDRRCAALRAEDPLIIAQLDRADQIATLPELSERFGGEKAVAPAQGSHGLLRRSSLYRLVRGFYYGVLVPDSWRERFGGSSYEPFEVCARRPFRLPINAPDRRTVVRAPQLDTLAVDLGDPRIQEGMRIVMAALLHIKQRTDALGIRLVVVLLRNKPTIYARMLSEARGIVPLEDLIHLVNLIDKEDRVADEVIQFLAQNRFHLIDTTPGLREALDRKECPYHESDDHHPNGAGYHVITRLILSDLYGDSVPPR